MLMYRGLFVYVHMYTYMNGDCKHADRANVRHGDLYASSMYDLLTHTMQ